MFLSLHRLRGVMVSTLDFESSDPSSNLGGTFLLRITIVLSWYQVVMLASVCVCVYVCVCMYVCVCFNETFESVGT